MKKLISASLVLCSATVSYAAEVDVYGQVNKTFVTFNDSVTNESVIVDNDFSSTRIGVRGTEILPNGFKAGVALEFQIVSNDSETSMVTDQVPNGSSTPESTSTEISDRIARITIGADTLGTFALGKFASATDGVTEIDLGGVKDVMGSAVDRMGGSLRFYDSQAQGYDAITVGALIDNMEGQDDFSNNGRGNSDQVNAVGYRSPIVSGFQLRGTFMQGGDYDASLRYNAKIGTLKLAAGIGYYKYNDLPNDGAPTAGTNVPEQRVSGSVSVKHDSGLSATAAFGTIYLENPDSGVKDPEFYYTKFGYEWDKYAIAVDFGSFTDIDPDLNNGSAETFSVGGQADWGRGISTAAFYRNIQPSTDDLAKTHEDISLLGVNLRVKF